MRQVRIDRGLSQESIGFLGGVDRSSISRHERGSITLDPKIIVMIARALRVRPTHLGGSS
jgi:transcriptional regulator with XRE-family HTH domain